MQIAQALAHARKLGVDRLDAQLLLGFILQRGRAWLLAHDDHPLSPAQVADWQAMLARRVAGEPLAYVIGEQSFRGLTLQVSPAVLVPRPETEVLVEWALTCLSSAPAPTVIDLGTGSGAVALAIKQACPGVALTATDHSEAALNVARGNAGRLGLDLAFAQGDWWLAVPGQRFGLAVSNPPYIAAGDPHLAALAHEPAAALTPGGDGLGALDAIIRGAALHLLPGAWLLLEHGHDQAPAVQDQLRAQGMVEVQTRQDLAGLARCSGGRRPPP